LITKITPQQVAQLITNAIQGVTINPQITPENNGQYYVVTFPVWGTQVPSVAVVQNCEQDGSGCYSVSFVADVGKQANITPSWLNSWNSNYLVVRAYSQPDGEVMFQGDCQLVGPGVPPGYITAFAGLFKQQVDQAASYNPSSGGN
jgi:hypothetical protein